MSRRTAAFLEDLVIESALGRYWSLDPETHFWYVRVMKTKHVVVLQALPTSLHFDLLPILNAIGQRYITSSDGMPPEEEISRSRNAKEAGTLFYSTSRVHVVIVQVKPIFDLCLSFSVPVNKKIRHHNKNDKHAVLLVLAVVPSFEMYTRCLWRVMGQSDGHCWERFDKMLKSTLGGTMENCVLLQTITLTAAMAFLLCFLFLGDIPQSKDGYWCFIWCHLACNKTTSSQRIARLNCSTLLGQINELSYPQSTSDVFWCR